MSRLIGEQQKRRTLSHVESVDELTEVQRTFAAIIRRPLNESDQMQADERADELIMASPTLVPHERLELYAQQYWWRIEQSFDEDFPLLRRALGLPRYQALRDAYLVAFPSRSFTLRDLGAGLGEYIQERGDLPIPLRQLACECAQLEWAIIEAFDAADCTGLVPADLADPAFLARELTLQPHVRLLHCQYPVNSLLVGATGHEGVQLSNTLTWEASGEALSAVDTNEVLSVLPLSETWLVVNRQDFRVYVKPVSATEFALLQLFQRGSSLEAWSESELAAEMDVDQLKQLFSDWTSLNWLGKDWPDDNAIEYRDG